jgi:hypothetical protein
MEQTMEAYKLIVTFQTMEEFAQQRNAGWPNGAVATHREVNMGRVASAQPREASWVARLRTARGIATTWLRGWAGAGAASAK